MQVARCVRLVLITAAAIISPVAAAAKPVVTCAYKWAESPDEVFIWSKWAHKLDAPAANNVDKASVVVNINGSSISLRAEHPTKTLELSFPLRHAIEPSRSTYTISTFGVTFTLRKWDLQHVWDDLHPEAWPRTRSSAVWWEMKQKHEAAVNEVNKLGASVKWLDEHPLGCEACRFTVEAAIFSASTLAGLREMPLPEQGSIMEPKSPYNTSLHALLVASCSTEALRTPPRHGLIMGHNAKAHEQAMREKELIGKGLKEAPPQPEEDTANEKRKEDNTLRLEMLTGCAALTKARPAVNRLLLAAHDVHIALLSTPEIARQTFSGWPEDLLQITASPEGRTLLRKTTEAVCMARSPVLCPLTKATAAMKAAAAKANAEASGDDDEPGGDGKVKVVSVATAPDVSTQTGQCAVCESVVQDLETKSLRHDPRLGQDTELHSGKKLGGAGLVVSEEVEAVCDELKWRHFEGGMKVHDYCAELVDTHDSALTEYAAAALQRGAPTPSGEPTKAVLSKFCNCKEPKKKKKAKGKKKGKPKDEL